MLVVSNQIFLFIIHCCLLALTESTLSFPCFVFTWHSWRGKSRIPNEAQTITHASKNLGLLAATVRVFPLHESALITQMPKEHETEMACAQKNLKCTLFPQCYSWLACFVSHVFPNHVHRWMTQQRNSCHSSMKWLVRGKFNMWFCADNTGVWVDLPCPGAGWWRRATRRRMGPLWVYSSLKVSCRMELNLKTEPYKGSRMVNHYINAPFS